MKKSARIAEILTKVIGAYCSCSPCTISSVSYSS